MEEPTVAEKKYDAEKHRLIGEAVLRAYARFLDAPYRACASLERHDVAAATLCSLDVARGRRDLASLTRSDNRTLSRVTRSLVAHCDEIDALRADFRAVNAHLVAYGESERGHAALARALPSLQEAEALARRSRVVAVATLRQLCALLGKSSTRGSTTPLFPDVLHALGDLLVCVATLDRVIESRPTLRDDWRAYRERARRLRRSGKCDARRLRAFEKVLDRLEAGVLGGASLRDALRSCDTELRAHAKTSSLGDEVRAFVVELTSRIERDDDSSEPPETWWKLDVFVAYYSGSFGTLDRKLTRRIHEANARACAYPLVGDVVWYPVTTTQVEEGAARRAAQARELAACFPREADAMCSRVRSLLVELRALVALDASRLRASELRDVARLLESAPRLARRLRRAIGHVLNLHAGSISRSVVLASCRLVEASRCLASVWRRDAVALAYLATLAREQLRREALALVADSRARLTRERSYDSRRLDALAALALCERALRAVECSRAPLVAALALSAGDLGAGATTELRALLARLEPFGSFAAEVERETDCSTLAWHSAYVLPAYLGGLVAARADVSRHGLVLDALSERLEPTHKPVLDRILADALYEPLAQLVESNVRLQTHEHLELPPHDPFESYMKLNFRLYPPVPLGKVYKSMRDDVEHRLSTTFYDLAAVAEHDRAAYGEMRRLARAEHGLETVDDGLPVQTLGHGLDVLEVMRNIDVFVERYAYDLNAQAFVERDPPRGSKYLNSIGIAHVANSIRTHGAGVMSTTVNFAYQLLRDKFRVFSQFIFDEQIKSRLMHDRAWYAGAAVELGHVYPYARAEKFNTNIRRLGVSARGETYLDLFRGVVTQIGNALGYVRLVRSGGRRCLADAASFVPGDDVEFDSLRGTDVPELTRQAAAQLDLATLSLRDDVDDYFGPLVEAFAPALRRHEHLRHFHAIVPPLTVNYVEHMLRGREKTGAAQRGCAGGCADDGFALGLAYVVEVLGQARELDSLHWFHSVERKIAEDRRAIGEQLRADHGDDKLAQALNLSMRKCDALEREFKLLYYGFNGARLFFGQGRE